MKRIVAVLFGGIVFLSVSCKKGECTCTVLGSEISTVVEADTREDYKDAKEGCENAGCDWSAKL